MHQCDKCYQVFSKSQGLQRHLTRKRPCIAVPNAEPVANSCKRCGNVFSRADSLLRHQQKHCAAPIGSGQEINELRARLARLEKQSNINVNAPVTVTNMTGPVTNVVNNLSVDHITIMPWGAPLQLTDTDIEMALATVPGLAGNTALPEVVSVLMELVKRSHMPEAARNVHINPKRCDQALALTAAGWAALPLAEATTALFDGASARIAAPAMCGAAGAAPRQRANPLRATLPMQYRADKEAAVALGLRPMEAHLANIAPGGPGPLVIAAPPAAQAPPAQAPPQLTHVERVVAVLKTHPLRCSATGSLLIDWIVAVSQAAGLSGRELFLALEAGGAELAEARAAAHLFTAEKMQLRP
jgi:hypothetical protein